MGRSNDRAAMPPPPARRRRSNRSRSTRSRNSSRSELSSASSSKSTSTSCPTSAITFHSSKHGRMRREQRKISVRQLQAAVKHGTRTVAGVPGRSKYTYKGITYIVDDATKQEITSYSNTFDVALKDISQDDWQEHLRAREAIRTTPATYCHSHSVLLVDVSGSMRNSDVQGSRTRLSAVWYAIAEDYIKNRIDSGQAGAKDAISIILMGETASFHPVLHNVPTDNVTYNGVLNVFKQGGIIPKGHGCFRPALALAESLLMQYSSSDCSLVLAVLSDGRPSDSRFDKTSYQDACHNISKTVAELSSKLGKRLTVSTVGMGSENQFETLKRMTEEAKDFGSQGLFQLPSMSSSGIGAAISSIATSLTETQTHQNSSNRSQRLIRPVIRENRKTIPALTEVVDRDEFQVYMYANVVRKVFDPDLVGSDPFREVPLQHPEARGVAIAKKAFGEGTERFAFQFYEVAADGVTVVGDALVAKESRFVLEEKHNAEEEMTKYLRRFCRIHHQATKVARAFNDKLGSIRTVDSNTARVSFLPCSAYHLKDPEKGTIVVCVEPFLFGRFEKWNSNNGWKKSRKPRASGECARSSLGSIQEEPTSMEEERDEAIVIDVDMEFEQMFVPHDEVAQAFSHFSFVYGGRKSLVCDLQGIFDKRERRLVLTDPVIHYHDVAKESKRGQYGRTDRGEKGIEDFLDSHECNGLCGIVTKGLVTIPASKF